MHDFSVFSPENTISNLKQPTTVIYHVFVTMYVFLNKRSVVYVLMKKNRYMQLRTDDAIVG